MGKDCHYQPNDVQSLKQRLGQLVHEPSAIVQIEECRDKSSIMHYQEAPSRFLKIYVKNPKYVAQLRTHFERGVTFPGHNCMECISETTYESNVLYALRFMIDNEIGGMTWVKVPKGKWQLRP